MRAMELFSICTGYGADRSKGVMPNNHTAGHNAAMRQIFLEEYGNEKALKASPISRESHWLTL